MLKKSKIKAVSIVMAALMAVGLLIIPIVPVAASDLSEAVVSSDYDFGEHVLNVKRVLEGFNIGFANFDGADVREDTYPALANLAKNYVPYSYRKDDYYVIMKADDLITFMKESFGIELPKENFGEFYEYDKDSDSFVWPDSDGGFGIEVFKILDIVDNADGTKTVSTDLYMVETEHYYETLFEDLKKPIDQWDKRVYYAKIGSPVITIKENKKYEFFPFEMVSVETETLDWADAQGTYLSENGRIELAFRIDKGLYWDYMLMIATDTENDKQIKSTCYIWGNAASSYMDGLYMYAGLISLTPGGELVVMKNPDAKLNVNISGTYTKESSEIPPQFFRLEYDVEVIFGEDSNGDEMFVGSYCLPYIGGLNDEGFEDELNAEMKDLLMSGVDEFNEFYADFISDIEDMEEEDAELAENLYEVSNRISYSNWLYHITASDTYNAVAELRTVYYGGAHTAPFIQLFNIDSDKKKLLSLEDIFEDDDWREKIEAILTDMSKTDEYKDVVYPDLEDVKIVNDKDFYLMDGYLMIFYQPYEIGPFVSSFISFRIPFDVIEDMLREEYLNAGYNDNYGKELFYNSVGFAVEG